MLTRSRLILLGQPAHQRHGAGQAGAAGLAPPGESARHGAGRWGAGRWPGEGPPAGWASGGAAKQGSEAPTPSSASGSWRARGGGGGWRRRRVSGSPVRSLRAACAALERGASMRAPDSPTTHRSGRQPERQADDARRTPHGTAALAQGGSQPADQGGAPQPTQRRPRCAAWHYRRAAARTRFQMSACYYLHRVSTARRSRDRGRGG